MNRPQAAWLVGRPVFSALIHAFAPFRHYGTERVPRDGPLVFCFNHFSWLDPWAIGITCPRTVYYVAKQEAHATPLMGPFIRFFGTLSVRRGESDREAVRLARQVVQDEQALGLFVEGTRQRSGQLGQVLPGAAMVALQEDVEVVPGAIHGSQRWRPGNFAPVSIAWAEPMRFDGLPRSGRGYRDASLEIARKLEDLWAFLVDLHRLGRPHAVPPR